MIPLVVVSPFYWRIGPHQVMVNLLSGLDEQRFDPVVAIPRGGTAEDDLTRRGIPVERVPGARNFRRQAWPVGIAPELVKTVLGARAVRRFALRRGARIVHTNNEACWSGMIGARWAGARSVVHVHGLGFARSRLTSAIFARVLNANADRVIAVSGAVAHALREAGVRDDRVRVVYNGIDTERFRPGVDAAGVRSEFGLRPGELAVGMFGALDPRKGHETFLQAAAVVLAKVPDVRFFVVGGGVPASADRDALRYRARVERLRESLGLVGAVVLTGEREDVPELMSMMDVMVQPSETEAGPLAPLEAMACGKPVVATNVGGNPEEVEHGETGLLVPPGDFQGLAHGILILLRAREMRQRFGIAGRARVEALFGARRMTRDIESVYSELVNPDAGTNR